MLPSFFRRVRRSFLKLSAICVVVSNLLLESTLPAVETDFSTARIVFQSVPNSSRVSSERRLSFMLMTCSRRPSDSSVPSSDGSMTISVPSSFFKMALYCACNARNASVRCVGVPLPS